MKKTLLLLSCCAMLSCSDPAAVSEPQTTPDHSFRYGSVWGLDSLEMVDQNGHRTVFRHTGTDYPGAKFETLDSTRYRYHYLVMDNWASFDSDWWISEDSDTLYITQDGSNPRIDTNTVLKWDEKFLIFERNYSDSTQGNIIETSWYSRM